MTQLEKEIEKKLRRMVESRGGWCLKWVCPGWSGVPDRILLLPGGLVMFVELKRPKGGRYSAMQDKWRDWLHALGFCYWRIENLGHLASFELVLLGELDLLGRLGRK
jgi:hypothetical protein